jgi:hypothetical protein
MHMHPRLAAATTVALMAAGFLAAGAPTKAASVPVAGSGTATAHSVQVQSAARQDLTAAKPGPVLGKNGKPARPSGVPNASQERSRPAPSPAPNTDGLNTGSAKSPRTRLKSTAGASVLFDPSFTGATEADSDCTACATPYVTAAVSSTQIAETVNLSLQVFTKSGTALCAENLTSLLGAFGGLTEPRIQYDNAADRYSMVAASVPSTSSDIPVFYLATSQTSDACGAWWVYTIILTGNQYPLGAQLNYPYLGQDSTSLLASTNNFSFSSSYLGSGAFAMPKSVAYTGNPFNITTYSVDFSTAPVTVAGIPTFATSTTYWVAAVPGSGYDVFSMPTNPAGAITFVGTADAPFNPPSRNVRQPGTSNTLNPLDGRIQSSVVQDGNYLWFANDVNDNGYPTVQYGAINANTGEVTDALAYHSSSSDDFNPSIAVSDQGDGTVAVWVNWAYTVPSQGVAVSATVNGVAPGSGVPDLVGNDLTLVTGTSATSIATFGAYSSAEIDPSSSSGCAPGLTALTAQEYFPSATQWATELATTTFC